MSISEVNRLQRLLARNASLLDLARDGHAAAGLCREIEGQRDFLEERFRGLRCQVDGILAPKLPGYPLGFCEPITRKVLELAGNEDWMRDLVRRGARPRQIYGIVKGLYFQNAIQLETIYIDVANDTVNVALPKIEIMPIGQMLWKNICDSAEYRAVASRYMNFAIYPNLCLPVLFPFMPFIAISPDGHVFPLRHQDVLLWKDACSDFSLSDRWLESLEAGDRLPEAAARCLERRAAGVGFPLQWRVVSPQEIRERILPDYRAQLRVSPSLSLFRTGLLLRDQVMEYLRKMPAVLMPEELDALYEAGLVPRPRDPHDLRWAMPG